ncbi:hypothetical protein KI387_003719 [Taxus chinensis]|uniref:Protein kinase domain-containing protein n=1 Tax=Taxus chinensis TaxID=29808 RepID=A0AA38LPI6_TAXCH|nr:hypothetical protein KI387_003719 [Taxus chinensis]
MDKLGDGEMNSEPSRACKVNAEESRDDPADARQIHSSHSLPDPSSNPENDKYFDPFELVEKCLGSFQQDEKYCGSFEPYSNLSLRDAETELGHVTLRQWLSRPQRTVNKYQCLHIFGQVVEAMNVAHSQGLILRNIRPSCVRLSSFNRISLIGPVNNNAGNNIHNTSIQWHLQSDQNRSVQKPSHDYEQYRRWQQASNQNAYYDGNHDSHASSVAMASSSRAVLMTRSSEAGNMQVDHKEESNTEKYGACQPGQTSHMEISWYTSPEELMGVSCSFATDVYSLGVLFFEVYEV